MDTTVYCVTCTTECGSHFCRVCQDPCHAIEPCCKIETTGEIEEGYGASVICMSCYEIQLSLEGGLEKKMEDKAVEEIRVEQEQETDGVNTKTNKKAKKPGELC